MKLLCGFKIGQHESKLFIKRASKPLESSF